MGFSSRSARIVAATAGLGLVAAGSYAIADANPVTASADVIRVVSGDQLVEFTGKGNGHGRGMGQWGSFGYAQEGWTAEEILEHYYGNTTLGEVDEDTDTIIDVELTAEHSAAVYSRGGAKVGDFTAEPGQVMTLSGGAAMITDGCGTTVLDSQPVEDDAEIEPVDAEAPLTFCGTDASYRGNVAVDGGKVLNVVDIEDYLRGVVPSESPAKWADEGGAEALKAQAVAARSYALADEASGNKFNDTQDSQVYKGVGVEDDRTDVAISETAGTVVRGEDGEIARTEFSSSTGGVTAGGEFPSVPDEGDAISPYHDWSTALTGAEIGNAFGVGDVEKISILERQNDDPAGRALRVEISGSGGSTEVTGMDFRTDLGLRSDWFTVATEGVGDAPAEGSTTPEATPSESESAESESAESESAESASGESDSTESAPTTSGAPQPAAVDPEVSESATSSPVPAADVDESDLPATGPETTTPAASLPPVTVPAAGTAIAKPTTVKAAPEDTDSDDSTSPSSSSPSTSGASSADPESTDAETTSPAATETEDDEVEATESDDESSADETSAAAKPKPDSKAIGAKIAAKYKEVGGVDSELGIALTSPIVMPNGFAFQPYLGGTIYYSEKGGAVMLPTPVLLAYLANGAVEKLGAPLEDIRAIDLEDAAGDLTVLFEKAQLLFDPLTGLGETITD